MAPVVPLRGLPRHNSCRLHRTKNPGGGDKGQNLARYGQTFKDRAVARLLPPESAAARLQAVITTAAMPEAGKNAWCREQGIYPAELEKWCASAAGALCDPQDARATPQATRKDRTRIKELERELLRKDRALAETAALLVLSKKVTAIFNRGEDA